MEVQRNGGGIIYPVILGLVHCLHLVEAVYSRRWKFLCKDSSTNRRPSSNTSTTSILFSFFLGWEAIH